MGTDGMQPLWWERPTCWVCDYWWIGLILLALVGTGAWWWRTSVPPSVDTIPAAGLQDVTVSQREITISVSDDGNSVDGDRIDLFVNGELVGSDITLTRTWQTFDVVLDSGTNQVAVVALNEGSSPPNTVALRISNVVDGAGDQVSGELNTFQRETMSVQAP